ncbi:uncharacterized protein LOC133832313 [Humulus lupulus]|uniref:uncharacterized protein LOC133832313 n=1 Tax=Humulus lupulus TaxID=3486 RepID=UPI002B411DEC|nr:uncharacterized protein LOC133832313 [Humulus lupulus]
MAYSLKFLAANGFIIVSLMDKTWIHLNSILQNCRATKEYERKSKEFVKTANLRHQLSDEVVEHLVLYGMDKSYKTWFHHGEDIVQSSTTKTSSTYNFFRATGVCSSNVNDLDDDNNDDDFDSLLRDVESPLYEGCLKYTKISSVVELYNLKTMHGFSNVGLYEMLEIINVMLPKDNLLLTSMYAINKYLKMFHLNYKHIHACVNDFCLFTKENANAQVCPTCQYPRWKQNEHTKEILQRQPAKLLIYFPITPRFQRMFRNEETISCLKWQSNNKRMDGKMSHLVDSKAWDAVNERWPDFSLELYNLRLGPAADGIDPYKNMSSTYSCWAVMLVVYNFPPSMCMKNEFTFLSMLIPGPKEPGNDIDVYLEPLINELLELWKGVYTYDVSTKKFFNLKAMQLWTINDFPAYGNLAGCATKGKYGCPICGENSNVVWLKHSKKMSFCNHIQFLPQHHPYRKKKYTTARARERAPQCPTILTGVEVAEQLSEFTNDFGKGRKRGRGSEFDKGWKKNILNTLLDCKGKSKDHYNSRLDLTEMGIMTHIHPYEEERITCPPATAYTLSKSDKKLFCKRLFDLKLPYGYSTKISNCVDMENHKLTKLKSHDCHVIMQQLLAISIRGLMDEGCKETILRLCRFFHELCQLVVDKEEIIKLELESAEIVYKLEEYFFL